MGGPLDVLQQQTNALADPNLNTRATLPQALGGQPGAEGQMDPRVIDHLAGQVQQGQSDIINQQFRTLQNVRHRFGVGIPTAPESERGFVNPKVGRVIEDWIAARKNYLMWPKEMGGGGMRQPTALTQAMAEARVNFPDVSMAQILGGTGPPQSETLSRFGVDISPERATRISDKKTLELLSDPITQAFLEDAREYQRVAGFDQMSARQFLNRQYESLVAKTETNEDIKAKQEASGLSAANWAKREIQQYAPHLSVVTALTGLY